MAKALEALSQWFRETPPELADFYGSPGVKALRNQQEVEVHVLAPARAVRLTKEFHSFHPLVRAVGGFCLDDAETSNHHLYCTHPALSGSVLFLAHDDDSRVVFASLGDYAAACQAAIDSDEPLSELHPTASPPAADQAELVTLIESLLRGKTSDIIAALIPSLDLSQRDLLLKLATHSNFYLGEAVARELQKRPAPHLREIAEACAAHRHPQVSKPGKTALAAINAL